MLSPARARLPAKLLTQMAFLAVGLTLGVAIGNQVRTALTVRVHLDVLPTRLTELAYHLHQQERALEALQQQVQELRAQASSHEQAVTAQQPRLAALAGELRRLKSFSGLTALEGPGVVVELDDSRHPRRPGENPNLWILHNYDVAAVVGDLWAAGAEAVAVNGERIVPTTAIRSVYTTLMINDRRLVPPLRILAIGDPRGLGEYLLRPGGPVERLQAFEFPARVSPADRVIIPAYRGAFSFKQARPSR